MDNINDEFRQFEIALKTIMRGNISDYNDLIYSSNRLFLKLPIYLEYGQISGPSNTSQNYFQLFLLFYPFVSYLI